MMKNAKHTGHQTETHKKFFGGKILTGILLAIFLIALAIFLLTVFTPIANSEETRIAALLPLSGENAKVGLTYQKGIEMALDTLHNQGKNITIDYYDSKGDPNIALDQFFAIIDAGYPAVLGPVTTGEAEMIAPYAEIYKTPMITYATDEILAKYKNYVFCFNPTTTTFGYAVVNILQLLGGDNLAVIWAESAHGRAAYQNILKEAEHANISITSIPIISVDETIRALNKTKANYAYVIADSTEQYDTIRLAQDKAGIPYPRLWITDGLGFSDTIHTNSEDEGTFVLVPDMSTVDPHFLAAYTEKYGTKFSETEGDMLYGYDSVITLAKNSNVLDTSKSRGEVIAENLKAYRQLGLTGPIVFNDELQRFPTYELYNLENGEWQNVPIATLIEQNELLLKPSEHVAEDATSTEHT